MVEDENNKTEQALGTTEPQEENFSQPPVIEKITLTEINDELENQKHEAERQEAERVGAIFDDFIKSFQELSEQDVRELIIDFIDKK